MVATLSPVSGKVKRGGPLRSAGGNLHGRCFASSLPSRGHEAGQDAACFDLADAERGRLPVRDRRSGVRAGDLGGRCVPNRVGRGDAGNHASGQGDHRRKGEGSDRHGLLAAGGHGLVLGLDERLHSSRIECAHDVRFAP